VRSATDAVPVVDGQTLHDVLQEWAIRSVQTEMPGFFNNARTVVLGGRNHDRTTRILREFTPNLEFADPLLRLDLPARLDANPLLGLAAKAGSWPVRALPASTRATLGAPGARLSHALARKAARDCDVVVATYEELVGFGLEDLAGKTLVSSAISDERLAELGSRGVDLVIDSTPQAFDVTVNAAMLEAMMVAATGDQGRLTNDDLLDMIVSAGLEPRLLYPNGPKRKSRFAFVIHPLSQEYFRSVEPLGTIAKLRAEAGDGRAREGHGVHPAVHLQPRDRHHVADRCGGRGLADHGRGHPEGADGAQPGVHLRAVAGGGGDRPQARCAGHGARRVHEGGRRRRGDGRQACAAADHDRQQLQRVRGAVGGARRAAALGLAETDEQGRIKGNAMVVGATGAIGSVCARLLALSSDELWLVSPESAKLLALKRELERGNHGRRSTSPPPPTATCRTWT
jgi:hypothetical protein